MYFVVGDPHGCSTELKEILKYWNRKTSKLIILGDLNDRGPDSYGCIKLAMKLEEDGSSICLLGNHCLEFRQWLEVVDNESFYYLNSFDETIKSFFPNTPAVLTRYTKEKIAADIRENHQDIIEFIKNRPLYYETEHLLFSHSGCNLQPNWKDSTEKDCLDIRNPFIYGENLTGKKIIFGHTPTKNMNEDQSDDVWVSPCGTKIGVDGGCVYGGQLNAVLIDDKGRILNKYVVKSKKKYY